jgi:hypothetical protein
VDLSRDPQRGVRVRPGSPVWAIPINAYAPGVKNVVLFYAFDSESVYLLSIQEVNDGE